MEIYICTDDQGRRITADRPIRECMDRPQRILNPDGSQRGVRNPPMTAQERAAKEAQERQAAEEAAAKAEAVRRDRNLLSRYRNEDVHRAARESALDPVRLTMDLTETRLAQLRRERRALEEETRAPKSKDHAATLKLQLEANEAAAAAQRENTASQRAELDRINRIYDVELERLKRLWAGESAGSMGAIESPTYEALPVAPSRVSAERKPAAKK
jgi:membrane-bound lytic murein transglycosylase B